MCPTCKPFSSCRTSCAMWLNISQQDTLDTLIWFPGVRRKTFRDLADTGSSKFVNFLINWAHWLKRIPFLQLLIFTCTYMLVSCVHQNLGKVFPIRKKKTQVGMSTTQPPIQTFPTLSSVSEWPANNSEEPLRKTANQCNLYQQHKLSH